MEKDNDKGSNSRISFDISTSHWKWRPIHQSSTSPSPRHLQSLVSHNNYLYLFGGFGDGEKYLDDLWQFSLGNLIYYFFKCDEIATSFAALITLK
jgi:hypothetical protein